MSERLRGRLPLGAALLLCMAAAVPAHAQHMRSLTSARQVAGDERRLAVLVEYGAGELRVEPARGDLLYRLELRYDEEQVRPVTEYDRASGRLKLGVESRDRNRGSHGGHRVNRGDHATVALSPRVPLALDLKFGAGQANVELGGLTLERVEIATGASESHVSFGAPNLAAAGLVRVEAGAAEVHVTGIGNARARRFEFQGGLGDATLDFGGAWDHSGTASVQMGMGSVTLRLPRSLGVRVTKSSFLTSFDHGGMVKRGDAWFSRNYDQARYKLDIALDAALGSIDIVWMD
jgi:hypothetical protein